MSINLDVFAKGWKEAHANMGESEPTPHRQGTETGKEIWDPLSVKKQNQPQSQCVAQWKMPAR